VAQSCAAGTECSTASGAASCPISEGSAFDLSPSGDLTCKGFVDCQNSCPMDNQGDFDACNNSCKTRAKMASLAKYNAVLSCGQSYCLGFNDAGPAKCALGANQTTLTELDGSTVDNSKSCGMCLNNALAALFVVACSANDSPDCNPTQCTQALLACLNDAEPVSSSPDLSPISAPVDMSHP
jgi:hypothetical protein